MLGVFCSDLHLSGTRPGCRGDDWMEAQAAVLRAINRVAHENECPVFVSGDVFHKPKEDPEAVSLAIRYMRLEKWYGIPGQHDLPGHNLKRIHESSFWNLVEAGVLDYIEGYRDIEHGDCTFIGIPYGEPIPDTKGISGPIIGLAHEMVFQKEPFPGAPKSGNVKKVAKRYKGFDLVSFGDNHAAFNDEIKHVRIINCGAAIRRTRTEMNYIPRCYTVSDDLSEIRYVELPTDNDIFLEDKSKSIQGDDRLKTFIDTLVKQQEVSLSFVRNVKVFIEQNKIDEETEKLIWEIIEEAKGEDK